MNINKSKTSLLYIGLFIILLFLFWQVPLVSDDFEFADLVRTKSLREIIDYILYYGNGRLLGNTLAITFVAFSIPAAFIKAATVLGIIILLPRVLGYHTSNAFLLSFLLVLGVSPQVFAQVFLWTSGFANYILPIFICLLALYLIQTLDNRRGYHILIFLLGISGQLFVEHNTIICLLLSGTLALYYHLLNRQERKISARVWFLGCLIGAALMFTLPYIFHIDGNRTEGYREYHFNLVYMIRSLAGMIPLIAKWTVLFAGISYFGCNLHKNKHGALHGIARGIYLTYPIISLLFNINEGTWIHISIRYSVVYFGLLLYLAILLTDVVMLKHTHTKYFLILFLMLAIIAAAPFLLITPFGERCMFLSYILMVIFTIKAVHYVSPNLQLTFLPSPMVLKCIVLLLSIFLCAEITHIRNMNTMRNEYIESCMEKHSNTIQIFELPSAYTFNTYLINRWYYYDTWGDISYEIVEYEEWIHNKIQE